MKIKRILVAIGFGIAATISTGCDQASFDTGLFGLPQSESTPSPFVIFSFVPTPAGMENLTTLGLDKSIVEGEMLPGIDANRRAAAVIYESGTGNAEPLVYLPVSDYEQLLDGLAKRVKLKRAVASSFAFGYTKILVMQVGDYAVFGLTLQGIKLGPRSASGFIQESPDETDFVFQWNAQLADEPIKKSFVRIINQAVGKEFAKLVWESDSMVCCLNVEPDDILGLQIRMQPVPDDPEDVLADLRSNLTIESSTRGVNNEYVLESTISPEQANSTLAQLRSVAKGFLQSKQSAFANRSTSDDPFGMSRIHGSVGGAIPSGAFSSGCGPTRRG